jgi:uncharacterized membrane protein
MTTEKRMKKIEYDIELLKEGLLERKPERFSVKDIVRAFFGALVIAATFVFSSLLVEIIRNMQPYQLTAIIIATFVILIAEIYFIGWSRIRKYGEKGRNVYEFTLKRLVVVYAVSIIVAVFYFYMLGFNRMLLPGQMWSFIFLVAMPCSIGAAVADLLKKY